MQPSLPFEVHELLEPFEAHEPRDPEYIRHTRARRYVVRVREDGSVRVTIPRWGTKREASAFAASQRAWIDRQRARMARERSEPREELSPEAVRALRARALGELPPRLSQLASEHGLAVSRVSVRNQKWRWGSCSPNGHICLNWRLVQVPPWVSDYVMIHELMHLKRLDHSRAFWKLVAAAFPAYREARAWLRTAEYLLKNPAKAGSHKAFPPSGHPGSAPSGPAQRSR